MKINYSKPALKEVKYSLEKGFAASAGATLPGLVDDWTNTEYE